MRRAIPLVLLPALLSAPAVSAAPLTMAGEDLDLAVPCAGQVRISVDPAMKDGAALDSSSGLQVTMSTGKEGAESRISLSTGKCAPEGKLVLSVSPNTGVSIHDSHDTHFIITGRLSSLDASLDSASLDAEDTLSLDMSLHGTSTAHIGTMERAARIVASGKATLTVDSAKLTALSAQLTESASMSVAHGEIDALTIVTADAANATVLGNASVATVNANGSGAVNIEHVTGPMVRTGTGSVHANAPGGVIYSPPAPASSGPAPSAPAPAATVPSASAASVPTPLPAPPVSAPPAPAPPAPALQTASPSAAPPSATVSPAAPSFPIQTSPIQTSPIQAPSPPAAPHDGETDTPPIAQPAQKAPEKASQNAAPPVETPKAETPASEPPASESPAAAVPTVPTPLPAPAAPAATAEPSASPSSPEDAPTVPSPAVPSSPAARSGG